MGIGDCSAGQQRLGQPWENVFGAAVDEDLRGDIGGGGPHVDNGEGNALSLRPAHEATGGFDRE